MDYIWASGFVLALWISVYLHLRDNIWTKKKALVRIGQNLGSRAIKLSSRAWSSAHMHTAQHTRFGSLDDLGQCFLPPFANVITAAQPFLSAWTTEMSGARFFSGSLQCLQLCLVLSVFVMRSWIPSEIHPQICTTKVHLSLHWCSCGCCYKWVSKSCYLYNEYTGDTAHIIGSALYHLGLHHLSKPQAFVLCSLIYFLFSSHYDL